MDIIQIELKFRSIINNSQYRYGNFSYSNFAFFVSKKMWNFIKREWGGTKGVTVEGLYYRNFPIFSTTALSNDIILFGELYTLV